MQTQTRMLGFDLARAFAVFGMVAVNFKIVMGAHREPDSWLATLVGLMDGRAAATFVVLAGVGLSLLSARARDAGDRAKLASNRKSLLKRALFLLIVGLLYTPIWPADILHFYGVYIALGSWLLTAPAKRLWGLAAFFIVAFFIMLITLDYGAEWNFETLSYRGFWTPLGMVKHLFYNGFHPVFPWAAFLFAGLWLGRLNLREAAVRKKVLLGSAVAALAFEGISKALIYIFSMHPHGLSLEDISALFGTQPMPPSPLYMLAAGATAIAFITLCCGVAESFPRARWITPLTATGQLALTLYVAHVLVGMVTLDLLGLLHDQSLVFSLLASSAFCVAAVVFSHFWRRRFARGPIEWLMRRLTQ